MDEALSWLINEAIEKKRTAALKQRANEIFAAKAQGIEMNMSVEEEAAAYQAIAEGLPVVVIEDNAVWRAGVRVVVGNTVVYDGKNYSCLQGHVTQQNWTPPIVPALWEEVREEAGAWVQPGGHNPYKKGDKVTHNGLLWISIADANVWEPGVFGWEVA